MNPWEKYQTSETPPVNSPVSDGPWSKYGGVSDSSTQPNQGFLETTGKTVGRIYGDAFNDAKDISGGLVNTIRHPEVILPSIAKGLDSTAKGIKQAVTHPGETFTLDNTKKTLNNIGDTVMHKPITSMINASMGLEGAGLGLKAIGEANSLSKVAEVGKGMSDVASAPVKATGETIGNIAKGSPGALRDLSGRMGNMMVKLPDKATAYGKDPMGTMAAEKIPARTITDYSKNAQDRLELRTKQLNDAVSKGNATVSLGNDVDKHLTDAYAEAKGSYKDRSDLVKGLDFMKQKMKEDFSDLNNMTLQDAVKFKRKLADDFPFTGTEAKDSTGNLLASTAHKIHHSINDAIDMAAPGVAQLNDRVSSLIDISKAAQKRVSAESRSNPLGFVGTLLGVGGLATHGVTGGAEGIGMGLALKVASSPFVLTKIANTLSRMADVDKLNLFQKVPWFKDIAQKAEQFSSANSSGVSNPKYGSYGPNGEFNKEFGGKAAMDASQPKPSLVTQAQNNIKNKFSSSSQTQSGNFKDINNNKGFANASEADDVIIKSDKPGYQNATGKQVTKLRNGDIIVKINGKNMKFSNGEVKPLKDNK